MPKAYVLANVKVNDPARYKSCYQDHVGALVKNIRGRFWFEVVTKLIWRTPSLTIG